MWSAQFVSNIGGWMQTVAAQWLMLTLTASATYVALVQTGASLPVVLLALLAGTVPDLVDRQRFLLIAKGLMLVAAAALGLLALDGLVTPLVLLTLVFALGSGQALTSPRWQTLQPELVPPAQRQQAISPGAVNMNLARAVGPAIGGILLAASSAGTVFLVNAATFLAVIAVLASWRGTRRPADVLPANMWGAMRAGGRYVAASPVLPTILLRAALFIVFASFCLGAVGGRRPVRSALGLRRLRPLVGVCRGRCGRRRRTAAGPPPAGNARCSPSNRVIRARRRGARSGLCAHHVDGCHPSRT
jgi:MFS family permease